MNATKNHVLDNTQRDEEHQTIQVNDKITNKGEKRN